MPPVRRLLAIPLLCLAFGALAAPASADLPSCAEAPCASDAGIPPVILAYYRGRTEPYLIKAVQQSGLPDDTPIYYGSYWGTGVNTRPPPSAPPPPPPGPRPVMPNRRFSPIFTFARTNYWDKRDLTPEEESGVRPGITGKVPSMASLLGRSGEYRYQAGLEVGRRMRDDIRNKRAHHLRVVTWQFDEIPNEAVGPSGWKYLQVVRGMVRGLFTGRPELGDAPLPGIVYGSGKTITGIRGQSFWGAVDDVSLYFVGEEYPDFVGAPGAAARSIAVWPTRLPPSLRKKYIAGVTPGYRLGVGLGGNVNHRGRSFVSKWQLSYIRARAQQGVAGFGQYNFNYKNASRAVMNDAMRAVGRGMRLLRGET